MSLNESLLAQNSLTWQAAYDFAQAKRKQAFSCFDSLPHSPAIIQAGIAYLDTALGFLRKPEVQELANDNIYLRFRTLEVCRDIAVGYALLGQTDKAIRFLDTAVNVDLSLPPMVDILEKEPSFRELRNQPEYENLVSRLVHYRSLFDFTPLLNGYTPNLSNAEKAAGVTLLWNEVRDKFVYFEDVPALDWNKTYLEYLEAASNTKSTLEYFRLLQRMCALLRDGHTNVYPPKELEDSVNARPPLRMMLVEGKVIVWKVLSDSLNRIGFRPGQEVVAIDGIPVKQYAERFVRPYISSSTPQDLDIRTFTYSLLAGSATKYLELIIQDGQKTENEVIHRSGYTDVKPTPDFEYRMLDHNIAYVALNSFGRDTVATLFRQHFDDIQKADALVLDLRLNGGGSGSVGFNILSCLTDHPYWTSKYSLRVAPDNLQWRVFPPEKRTPQADATFSKQVVVLVGPMIFSAFEGSVSETSMIQS